MAKKRTYPNEEEGDKTEDLLRAIEIAGHDRVKAVLRDVCLGSKAAFELASSKLLVAEVLSSSEEEGEGSESEGSEGSESEESEVGLTAYGDLNRKQVEAINGKRLRYLFCIQCKAEFDTSFNDPEACRWHDGDLEPVDDRFVDWDDDCHGDRYSKEIERQHPENYDYSCCEEDGKSEGCKVGWHIAQDRTNPKRPRVY